MHHLYSVLVTFGKIILLSGLLNFSVNGATLAAPKDKLQQQKPLVTLDAKAKFSAHNDVLRDLMLNLYACDSQQLVKNTKVSKEEYTDWVFAGPFGWKFDAIRNLQSLDALRLSINQDYQGDYVLPLITGLHTHILQAYGGESEFSFPNTIRPNKLFNTAHNVRASKLHLLKSKASFDDACEKTITHHFNFLYQEITRDALSLTNNSNELSHLKAQEFEPADSKAMEFINE